MGKPLNEFLRTDYQNTNAIEAAKTVRETGSWSGEVTQACNNGTRRSIWASVSLIKAEDGQPIGFIGINRDVTERKRAETQANQMKRLYATLSQANQTIVRIKSRDELYQSICEVAVQFGEFPLAWIGLLDEATGDVRLVASKGLDMKEWPFQMININKGASKNGLMATAIRTSQVVTSKDAQEDKQVQRFHSQIQQYGYHSSAAVPFRFAGKTIGIVGLVSKEVGLLATTEEIRLLEEMGLDISFALDAMAAEQSQAYLAAIVASSNDAIISKDLNGIVTSWNLTAEKIFGYQAQEMIGQSILRLIPPDRVAEEEQILEQIKQGKHINQFETVRIKKNGMRIDVSLSWSPIKDTDGNVVGISKIARDITSRKQVEQGIVKRERQMRALVASLDDIVFELD